MARNLVALAAAAALPLAFAAPAGDAVTTLPGFGAVLSATYSGYLDAGAGKKLHYMYTAALNNAAQAPTVFWFNGGPGCSSLDGLFSESGLYHIQEFSNPPTLYQNPWAWANVTNMVFLESPAGVGFSYCETAAGCAHTDTSSAVDNLAAVVDFYLKFPELSANELWIAGESYAGIYIPMLAYNIYNYNQGAPAKPINLKGTLVGNGCIGNAAGHCGNDPTGLNNYHDVMQWRGHGLMSETTYDAVMSDCAPNWAKPSLACEIALAAAATEQGNLDVYDLYNTCADPAAPLRAPVQEGGLLARALAGKKGAPIDPNCFSTTETMQTWANQPAVKAALNVAPAITFSLCSNNRTFRYTKDMVDERVEIYPTLTQKAGYEVLVFNGEADLCVPYTDNEWWTRSMNYTVTSPWAAWSVEASTGEYVGGYRVKYSPGAGATNSFVFATVRGAGHMVPQTRPESAYTLMMNHIFGKW